jgi:hypothetical protein
MATATVDWGDGSAVQNVTVTPSGPTNAWTLPAGVTHPYAATGTYQVKLTGPGGGVDQKPAVVTVEVVVLTVAVNGSTVTASGTGHT